MSSSCYNAFSQERRSITHVLFAAVPMRFVTAACKPAKQERRTKSTNGRAQQSRGDSTKQIQSCSKTLSFCLTIFM